MRRSINLLPVERKNAIKIDKFSRFLFKVGFMVIFSIFLFAAFLLANLLIINIYKNINQEEVSRAGSGELNDVIQEAKNKIDDHYLKTEQSVKEINRRISYWEYLNQINQLLPKNVYYSRITMEPDKVKVEGLARNRDDLVDFIESLEMVDVFQEVAMPISNLTSQENVNFEINLNLDKK
ncbi:MAG: PilN domain-containing protein [Candidatus Moranbacteria bacterium]|nr:PilN domain-containing protein [Candidatus Moranbacteria bacterium]